MRNFLEHHLQSFQFLEYIRRYLPQHRQSDIHRRLDFQNHKKQLRLCSLSLGSRFCEINESYIKGLKFHYVNEMSEVIELALTDKLVKNPKKL